MAFYHMQMQQENALITDDAMVVENMLGTKIRLVEGSYENIKLTTPEDLKNTVWNRLNNSPTQNIPFRLKQKDLNQKKSQEARY